MHTTIHIRLAVEDFLCVVRHIDDHSVLILESFGDGKEDRVVIEQRIVVLCKDALLLVRQIRTVIHQRREMGKSVAWITGSIIHMGTHQMEDHQLSLLRGVLWQCVVCFQHSVVEAIGLSIANVELSLAQFRIVQEEPSTEVVDSLLRLG